MSRYCSWDDDGFKHFNHVLFAPKNWRKWSNLTILQIGFHPLDVLENCLNCHCCSKSPFGFEIIGRDYWGFPNFEHLKILQHTICCSRYPADNQHSSSNGVGRSLPSISTCLVVAPKNDRFSLKEHLFRTPWFLRLDFGPMVLNFSMLTLYVWFVNPECHFNHQICHQVILLQLAHRDGEIGFHGKRRRNKKPVVGFSGPGKWWVGRFLLKD